MRVNRQLNLVLPVDTDNGKIHVHSTPIGRDIYEQYWKVLALTVTGLAKDGLSHMGPSLAMLSLRDAAEQLGVWEDITGSDGTVIREGVENGLLPEIRRLTSVIVRNPEGGWRALPLEIAISQGALDDGDRREVESAIVFFICSSAMAPHRAVEELLNFLFSRLEREFTYLNATAWANSLQTSTQAETSGAQEPLSPATPTGAPIPS